MYLPGGGSKDDMQSVTQQMSGMKVQEVGMRAGREKEVNFNEERSRVSKREQEVVTIVTGGAGGNIWGSRRKKEAATSPRHPSLLNFN